MRVVLASASPRRRELLEQIGVRYEARPVQVDESRRPREAPRDYVSRLARAKAETAWRLPGPDGRAVLAADTAVVLADSILGKPGQLGNPLIVTSLLSFCPSSATRTDRIRQGGVSRGGGLRDPPPQFLSLTIR